VVVVTLLGFDSSQNQVSQKGTITVDKVVGSMKGRRYQLGKLKRTIKLHMSHTQITKSKM
jgi:hypothetical protein